MSRPKLKKVALLGASFNPIGLHHQRIAEVVWLEWKMKTWLMPCYQHMFDKNSQLIESAHRWNMVCEVCSQSPYMQPCDWELVHEHTGAMYETLTALTQKHKHHRFHVIIGSDNANILEETWFAGSRLIEEFSFIVMERPGDPLVVDWPKRNPHKVLPFFYDMSSSEIRNAIRDGNYEFAQRHTDPRVWDYITTGRLYGYKGHNHA